MGGWNIYYALLNFAILAAVLYFVGKKIVVKKYKSRRSQIEQDLKRSEEASKKAEELGAELKKMETEGEAQCQEIVSQAEQQAEEEDRRDREDREGRQR